MNNQQWALLGFVGVVALLAYWKADLIKQRLDLAGIALITPKYPVASTLI